MLTAQNIIDDVRTRLTIDSNYISDADFYPLISKIYFEVYNTIIEANQDFFGTGSTAVTMIANTATYALPNAVKFESLEFAYDGTNYYKGEQIERWQWDDYDQSDGFEASSPVFDIWGNSATIGPVPDATDIANGGKFRIFYIPDPVAVTAASDTLLIPTTYQYTVTDGVEAEAWMKIGEQTKEDRARNKYNASLQKLRTFAAGRDLDQLIGMSWVEENYWSE